MSNFGNYYIPPSQIELESRVRAPQVVQGRGRTEPEGNGSFERLETIEETEFPRINKSEMMKMLTDQISAEADCREILLQVRQDLVSALVHVEKALVQTGSGKKKGRFSQGKYCNML